MINLGNGVPYLLKDFIGLVEKYTGKKAIIEIMPEQPGDVERTCADINKARNLLGYAPETPFEKGISETVTWYQEALTHGLFDESVKVKRIEGTALWFTPKNAHKCVALICNFVLNLPSID